MIAILHDAIINIIIYRLALTSLNIFTLPIAKNKYNGGGVVLPTISLATSPMFRTYKKLSEEKYYDAARVWMNQNPLLRAVAEHNPVGRGPREDQRCAGKMPYKKDIERFGSM